MILTPREDQIIRLFVECGFTSKEAAVELGIETKTVEAHRSNIMRKLRGQIYPGAQRWQRTCTAVDLVLYAVVNGLVNMSKIESKYGAGIPSPS